MTIDAVKNYTRLMAPAYDDFEQLAVWTFFSTLFTSGQMNCALMELLLLC